MKGGGAGLECQQPGIRSLGTWVGSRTLRGLRGNRTSAEPTGGQGPQAAENWKCCPTPSSGQEDIPRGMQDCKKRFRVEDVKRNRAGVGGRVVEFLEFWETPVLTFLR